MQPLPAEPGQPERFDYEYVRNGTANLFMISEPLLGWRAVQVTERRTAKDFAEVLRWLVEDVHPEAEKIVLVMDNLNTHKLASLYEAFPPEQARRIAEKLEIHHTPKHGSWLNMAEIELSVLAAAVPGPAASRTPRNWPRGDDAWEEDRNERGVEVKCASPRPMPGSSSIASTRHFNSGGPLYSYWVFLADGRVAVAKPAFGTACPGIMG